MTRSSWSRGERVQFADRWSFWPLAGLRSAGMPFDWVLGFGCPEAYEQDGPEAYEQDGPKPPEQEAPEAPEVPKAPEAREQAARTASARAARHLVRQSCFVEAVQWQNPAVIRNWLGDYRQALLRADPADEAAVRLSRRDQRETLLATLAQRYCAKNETIGFFGPVAWAHLVADDNAVGVTGTRRLRSRTTTLEWHAVDALAKAAAADPGLRGSVPLRRHPLVSVSDAGVHGPRGPYPAADPLAVRVLRELASPLDERTLHDRVGDPAVVDTLARLEADGIVLRDLVVAVCDDPIARFDDRLATLADSAAKAAWQQRVRDVRAAVDAVAAAASDPDALGARLSRLDTVLADAVLTEAVLADAVLAGAASADRQHRYGRTAVYQDCRLDLDVRLGSPLLTDLARPLGLLLHSARWLVGEVGREVLADLSVPHAQLAKRGRPVTLAELTLAGADVLSGAPNTAVHRVLADFTARWAEILELADDGVLATERAQPLVDALFHPTGPLPWQAARQHSPDLMLRARSGQRPQWVLGELHLALNTLENRPFRSQADDPAVLADAARADYPLGRIVPVWPGSSPEVTSRTYPPLAHDLPDVYDYWSYAADEGHPASDRVWPGTDLLVEPDRPGELVVRPRDRAWQRPLGEFLGEFLTALVVNRFQLRAPTAHAPRLLIDDVVVERETWRVPVADLLGTVDADYLHRGLSRALGALGCPRFLFASLAGQRKPVFVDRSAPLLLRALARLLRAEAEGNPAAEVKLVEMLPEPGALWLRDAEGRPVTSEFRVVVAEPPGPDAERVSLPVGAGTA